MISTVWPVYMPSASGRALIRDFKNDGDYIHYYLGVSANCKLFDNSQQLYANMSQNTYRSTGSCKESCHPFRIQLQAVYYRKSFNFLVSWGNPQRDFQLHNPQPRVPSVFHWMGQRHLGCEPGCQEHIQQGPGIGNVGKAVGALLRIPAGLCPRRICEPQTFGHIYAGIR